MSSRKKRFPTYSKIIRLYPKEYRKEYGEQILQTTADMLDNAPSSAAKLAIWTKVALDLPLNIGKQQFNDKGSLFMKQTPWHVKRVSILSSLLILPFFAALMANALDKTINNHTLYNSWLWDRPAIGLWVLYLPLTALLLACGSFLIYLAKDTKSRQSSWLKRALDIKHSWPIIIPGIIAFGILFMAVFHDSVQCWVQTPDHALTHIQQTWQCTTRNLALF